MRSQFCLPHFKKSFLVEENPVKMYEGIDVFVRHDGETREDQILGLKRNERVHSLERYIQDLDFDDELWNEIYVLNEQLTRRFINVLDIVRKGFKKINSLTIVLVGFKLARSIIFRTFF